MHNIHFGTLGLKIGDEITYIKDDTKFIVSSGNGTPENGGTMIRYHGDDSNHHYSLRYMSRRLMGDEFDETKDIFELWAYEGETLTKIWRKKQQNK